MSRDSGKRTNGVNDPKVGDEAADEGEVNGANDAGGATEPTGTSDDVPDIDEGRYVYCVVRADEGESIDATGVDDEPVSLVASDGIGAIVHACDGIYDSADFAQVRRWLVRHQAVIDEAGEAFGTPLPFQFDTIIRGDDDRVREWIAEERESLAEALDSLAGHWEYRVEVVRTDPVDDDRLVEADDRLAELREQIDDSGEGTAFLLEKKYEQRAKRLREHRRSERTAELRDRLADHAREVHELERSSNVALAGASDEDDGDRETICRLTLLAHEDDEGAIGSILDDVANEPGLEVRFTGPWPPYTFAPSFGEESDGESSVHSHGTE